MLAAASRRSLYSRLCSNIPYHMRHNASNSLRACLSTKTGKSITILALESSADDTCAAIVSDNKTIHANVVLKQDDLLGQLSHHSCFFRITRN
jgi:hypothetical protein